MDTVGVGVGVGGPPPGPMVGTVSDANGAGVEGDNNFDTHGSAALGCGVLGVGYANGVIGRSRPSTLGSDVVTGVTGLSDNGAGVYGHGLSGNGVRGLSEQGDGVLGLSKSSQHAAVSAVNEGSEYQRNENSPEIAPVRRRAV
jgi:hypothetical protein